MHRFSVWRDSIRLARDERTIEATLAEYVACLRPHDIAALSPRCRRVLGDPTLEVAQIAEELLREELHHRGNEQIRSMLHEIAHTFAAAAVRLSQVRGEEPISASK